MSNTNRIHPQSLVPQHLLSRFAGVLAESKIRWLKDHLIARFMRDYQIDMSEAKVKDPKAYASFNDFFTRQLQLGARPICKSPRELASPVDGFVAQIGKIENDQLLQAKGFNYSLLSLLAGDSTLAKLFTDGEFSTLYLAPQNYHRVHIPLSGTLQQSIFVPGKLYSVNQATSAAIPNLFSRNERLITLYNTEAGPMAVIFVGAMIVGSIQATWMHEPMRTKKITRQILNSPLNFEKGDELGYFKLGSTVILLFGKDQVEWQPSLIPGTAIRMGECIGALPL